MSFSSDVREELSGKIPGDMQCVVSEAAAVAMLLGRTDDEGTLIVETENITLAKTYLKLVRSAFDIRAELEIKKNLSHRSGRYTIALPGDEEIKDCLTGEIKRLAGFLENGSMQRDGSAAPDEAPGPENEVRSFLRGAFLASGTMSDPGKAYHFEIVCRREREAAFIEGLFGIFDIKTKYVKRKGKSIVYLKESDLIVNALNVMGAHVSLMKLENIRIIKDMKNSANRQYNCDFANINKIVKASSKQASDIRLIMEKGEFEQLPDSLKSIAIARLEHPDASLSELGEYLDPPVGKSGVNHRLRKISEIAEKLKEE